MNRAPARHVTPAVPTVVVDPNSQVPKAPVPAARRRELEPTLILKGRKLDTMRAQVAAQRAAHRKRKQMGLLVWAFAGGIALSLGWLVGVTMNFDAAERDDAPTSDVDSSAAQLARDSSPAPDPAVAPRRAEEPAPPQRDDSDALSLADLPTEPEVASEGSAQSPTPSDDDVDGALGEDSETLTLDDLPID